MPIGAESRADFLQLTRFRGSDGQKNGGGERAKASHSIGCGANDNHAKRQEGNILLKFDIAIEGDKCIAMLPGAPHQFAIEHAAPAELNNGAHIVAWQFPGEVDSATCAPRSLSSPSADGRGRRRCVAINPALLDGRE